MGYRRTPIAVDEWYHCFNRGIDRRTVFESEDDCRRFEQLLYLANDIKPIDRDNFSHLSHGDILQRPRKQNIVSIAAYCLMKKHYHIALQEVVENGISTFMQKLGTGYAMYFNKKHARIGNLFVKPFRSKHIDNDAYLRKVVQYIHLNPAEIFEHQWKDGIVRDMKGLHDKLTSYEFSSCADYFGSRRVERAILDENVIQMVAERPRSLGLILQQATAYYAQLNEEF